MSAEQGTPRRRQSEVYRNIDDPLKVMGVLSLKSCSMLVALYGVSYVLDFVTDFWRRAFGPGAFLLELALFAAVAFVLMYAEKHDDEHLVWSMLRYWASRRTRVLYCGARPDGWPVSDLEWVFVARARERAQRVAEGRDR